MGSPPRSASRPGAAAQSPESASSAGPAAVNPPSQGLKASPSSRAHEKVPTSPWSPGCAPAGPSLPPRAHSLTLPGHHAAPGLPGRSAPGLTPRLLFAPSHLSHPAGHTQSAGPRPQTAEASEPENWVPGGEKGPEAEAPPPQGAPRFLSQPGRTDAP